MDKEVILTVIDDNPTGAFITERTISRWFENWKINFKDSVENALTFVRKQKPISMGSANLILIESDIGDAGCMRFLKSYDLLSETIKNQFEIVVMSSGLPNNEDLQKIRRNPLVTLVFNAPWKEDHSQKLKELVLKGI
ncbi:MAG: hypothetical protein ACR2MX_18815 [Cyclobacteriaceae bacterium]